MAITKILPRSSGLRAAIQYVLNGDKTQEQILTAYLNCDPGYVYQEMMDTKRATGKTNGRQCYHIIQSFAPNEISPELALEIAVEFAQEHLPGYQVVIGTHVDRQHIHSHILFNSVNDETGAKYHCSNKDYYQKIRAVSDRICQKHGLSIIVQAENSESLSYIEWLRQSKGQHTYRSMLESDIRRAIEDANDIGDFYMLMEHMGYEIKYGKRLGFRLRGQEHFMYPGRKNHLFTEDGIRNAIQSNMDAIESGLKPALVQRESYRPYKKHPKYTGFMALYVHYLYILGKIEKRQSPPRITAHAKAESLKAEAYQKQFIFLREHSITTETELQQVQSTLKSKMTELIQQRTILNVQKKKKREVFDALATVKALETVKSFYEQGLTGMESEYEMYLAALEILNSCGIPQDVLIQEKSKLYTQLSDVNHEIRHIRGQLESCQKIQTTVPEMERDIQAMTQQRKCKRLNRERWES